MSNLATVFDTMLRPYHVFDNTLNTSYHMPVNLSEDDDAYYVSAEYPGVKKEDIKIELDNNVLTLSISAENENTEENENIRYLRKERQFASVERQFRLPRLVDTAKVKADYTDGVLNIRLEKAEPAKPKQIEIKVQ